jgi:O-ureido-D-serine cyclo-ligase
MARTIALVTAHEARALDEDLPPLVAALRALGADVDTPIWDDPAVDWARYDASVIRSTWDYADRIDEFLAWTERTASQTRLFNPPGVLRWNTDKHYLRDLARAGVPVVPTRFVEPGEAPAEVLASFLRGGTGALSVGRADGFDEFVVKPAVGAGSRDAARYRRDEALRATNHLARLLEGGRSTLLQPYLSRVDDVGETALIHIDGRFSHAIRKAALLRLGEGFVAGLFAPEEISARQPGADELAVSAAACAAIVGGPTLYARIDLIRDAEGRPVVLELELAEPSLFFAFAPGSAERFAAAILARCAGRGESSEGG